MDTMDTMAVDDSAPPSPPRHDDDDRDSLEHARPRKRTRRACDKCSSSRTRCDGECPCHRCKEYGYSCRYNREIKKRGRVPTSSLAGGSANSDAGRSITAGAKRAHSDEVSPSPPLTSPSGGMDLSSHCPSMHRAGHRLNQSRPPLGHNGDTTATSMTAPPPPAQPAPPQLASPSAYGSHAHLQLSTLLEPTVDSQMSRTTLESPSLAQGYPRRPSDHDVLISDDSAGYPSPANVNGNGNAHSNGAHQQNVPRNHERNSFGVAASSRRKDRRSYSTSTGAEGSLSEVQRMNSLYRMPTSDCRYRCLDPVIPHIRGIIPASVACDLLDVYLTEPGSSLFRCASPYILTRIFRKKSLLHPTSPRPTTPALLATMLWASAQTADIVLLHVPGSRAKITNALYGLATSLISERDPDRWRRIHGGLRVENDQADEQFGFMSGFPTTTATNEPAGVVDDVLTFILLAIAVSGGDFKSDCLKWWSKAIRLAMSLHLNREDEKCSASPCANPICSCRRDPEYNSLVNSEVREERRRVFWLLYCLDRHLALSFNTVVYIPDSYCEIYAPLPENVWENLDTIAPTDVPARVLGPPTIVTGTGYFEYFLPLMAILGDIIEVHHRRQHPRLGQLEDSQAVAVISELLRKCERSLETLTREIEILEYAPLSTPGPHIKDIVTGIPRRQQQQQHATSSTSPTAGGPGAGAGGKPAAAAQRDCSRLKLVTAYSTHILHVLHVLLHGKWDAISMLDDDDDWITSTRFNDCASHAIAASQAVSQILKSDPELTFMPYLFGIYLLHGSFILLLFADRMPQLGPNQSVEQACETIIRAHEVCVVTLSTEFQKNFRKVLRSTLYSVRGSSPTEWEEHKARRRALSLYRWTKGAKGLAL